MHDSLVTTSLIRETIENEFTNEGYKFGQEEETSSTIAAHGYFGQLSSNILVSTILAPLFCLQSSTIFD